MSESFAVSDLLVTRYPGSFDVVTHSAPRLTFRPVVDEMSGLDVHRATTPALVIDIRQHTQAAQRVNGTWFMTIAAQETALSRIMRFQTQHHTMTEAREYAARVVAVLKNGTTLDQLREASRIVREGVDDAIVDLDVEAAPAAVEEPAAVEPTPIVVIPCAAAKQDAPAVAAELYTSANFALMLRAARKVAAEQNGRVLILSALHGLLELDALVAPYDVKMGDPDSIAAAELADQLAAIAPTSITTLLPHNYGAKLDAAAELAGAPDLIDLFADAPGIGYQRGVAARVLAAA